MKIYFWQKKEFWALILFIVKGVNSLSKPDSFIYQLSDYLLQVGIPLLLAAFGISDGLKNNSLMYPLNKILGKVK
ncbi:Hypothetical protein IALB_0079 [Ignavibacterium album JCM 16511]|uniref:Uncharacterized protein n=1 Tax=Ignavibacterium album (strain DSM 19864 / JCM 16511 / NBRC 101810 / Mat9-16) TaxID=945713 RepID=I0AFN6_IGNAJ|nr:hypothetical protein [Ignavibacterium album]AFH47793.1 Hypothetical protein IALB_0079 [Ignavibacterium album JCM 16511]